LEKKTELTGTKAHDGIVAFSQTDFTEDLKKILGTGSGYA
jgi:hypothetical protein